MIGTRLAVLALLALVAQPLLARSEPADGYTYAQAKSGGTGKFFMGREIANVLGLAGAPWLDRSDREKEEGTDRLIPLLGLKASDVVADVGAGTGYFSFALARAVPAGLVYAQDIQPGMLEIVKRKAAAPGSPGNVRTVLGTATDPGLGPGSADLILMVDVWHELLHPREMGLAMAKALKPGGRLALVEYRGEADWAQGNLHAMTVAQVRREMESLGFRWLSTDSTTLPLQHVIIFARPER